MDVSGMPAPGSGKLAHNLVQFGRALRSAGMPVGTHQILAALDALVAVGIGRREDFYWTLASVFVSRREQIELFDLAFRIFWQDPGLLRPTIRMALPTEELAGESSKAGQRPKHAPGQGAVEAQLPAEELDRKAESLLSFSSRELLQKMDFDLMTADELAAAKQLIERLALPLREVRTRRLVRDPRGARVDGRATLKAAIAAYGDMIPLRRVAPRRLPPPLVVLVDISGSMRRYGRMFLHFVHGLTGARQRVSVFLFATRLTSISRELRQHNADAALDRISEVVRDWASGTRIGACLQKFNRLWSRRLLGQNTIVLLLSDGLDSEGSQGLTAEMERLHKSCRQLWWLNPMAGYDGFEVRASGIVAMRPHVDLFLPAHNLQSLADLGRILAAPPRTRRPEAFPRDRNAT